MRTVGPRSAEQYKAGAFDVHLSGHFLDRRDTRVQGRLDIPYESCVKAAQRFPYDRCRTLVNDGKYWVFFKWKPNERKLVILSVLPKDYFLPYPGIWVKT